MTTEGMTTEGMTTEGMTTHFIITTIEVQQNTAALLDRIQVELEKYGHPLRWAVTDANLEQQTLTVEALVTKGQLKINHQK